MLGKEHIPGIVFSAVIALVSSYVASLHPSFDSLVISILIGMFAGNLLSQRALFTPGNEVIIRLLLPLGIALYGTQLSLGSMQPGLFVGIVLVFILTFGLSFFLARIFHLDHRLGMLLASGLSVCGASAIAVISPLIGARREDTSIAILSVMMLGLTGMIGYPLLYDYFPLSYDEFNFFAGTTLPMIGQVKVAAGNVCPECVNMALQIKLVRVSFLILVIPLAMFFANRGNQRVRVPWFIVSFIFLALIVNLVPGMRKFVAPGGAVSSFCLTAGLAAIGFTVDFDEVVRKGLGPLGVIVPTWIVVLVAIFLLRNIF